MTKASDAQLAAAARSAGFSGNDVAVAVAVALAESGGQTDVTHSNIDGSTDYGAWQINSVHPQILASGTWSNLSDNAKMAKAVFDGQGWHAWSTYNSGAYLPFLIRGRSASNTPGNTPAVPVATTPATDTTGNLSSGVYRIALFVLGAVLLGIAIARMS
jgi:hypothetical protein